MKIQESLIGGSVEGRRFALELLATVMYLQTLDDLWTGEVVALRSREVTLDDSMVEGLARVHQEMQDGLYRVEGMARELGYILNGIELSQVTASAEALSDAANDDIGEILRGAGLEDFDLRGAVITACQYVSEEAASERDALTKKWNHVKAGDASEGDFRPSFKCALYLVGLGATVTATIATGGAPVIVGVAVAGQCSGAVHGWEKSGCSKAVSEISRARR